jgi:hypothetical protein
MVGTHQNILQGADFSFPKVQTDFRARQASYTTRSEAFSPGIKRPEREADHSLLFSAENKDERIWALLHAFLVHIGATLLFPFLHVLENSSQLCVCVCVCVCACVCARARARANYPFVSLIYYLLHNVYLLNLVINSNSHHRKLY